MSVQGLKSNEQHLKNGVGLSVPVAPVLVVYGARWYCKLVYICKGGVYGE